MNLGIYVDSLQENEQVHYAIQALNKGIEDNHLVDASLFYDSVGHNAMPTKCGCFNSTDLWNFTGTLITTSLNSAKTALSIVNKFRVYFYHGWEQTNDIFGLINLVKNPTVETICRDGNSAKELYRLTGSTPLGLVDNFNLSEILQQVDK